MARTRLRRRLAEAYGVDAPSAPIPPGIYLLVSLGEGSSQVAIERYLPTGAHAGRMASIALAALDEIDLVNDSALLVTRDPAGLTGPMTAILTGRRTDSYDDGFSTNNLHGVWSWDWAGGGGVESFVEQYTGEQYFRPQLQRHDGWLQWQALLDRPAGVADDVILGRRARLDLSSLTSQFASISGDVEGVPFGLGHCWISATHHRYRYLAQVGAVPTTIVSRWPVAGGEGTVDADPGWSLAQGCADPAGGDVSLGARSDLASPVLHRATGAAGIAAAWADAVPANAVRALAAAVDVASGVSVGYVLDDDSVSVFHGDPAAAAAQNARTLATPTNCLALAVAVEP